MGCLRAALAALALVSAPAPPSLSHLLVTEVPGFQTGGTTSLGPGEVGRLVHDPSLEAQLYGGKATAVARQWAAPGATLEVLLIRSIDGVQAARLVRVIGDHDRADGFRLTTDRLPAPALVATGGTAGAPSLGLAARRGRVTVVVVDYGSAARAATVRQVAVASVGRLPDGGEGLHPAAGSSAVHVIGWVVLGASVLGVLGVGGVAIRRRAARAADPTASPDRASPD